LPRDPVLDLSLNPEAARPDAHRRGKTQWVVAMDEAVNGRAAKPYRGNDLVQVDKPIMWGFHLMFSGPEWAIGDMAVRPLLRFVALV